MNEALNRLGTAASRFLGFLPAVLLGGACARALEFLFAGAAPGDMLLGAALDLLALARYLPLLFLLTLPALLIEADRARWIAVGGLWSAMLVTQICLMQYALITRVPLGADLFGYSVAEVAQSFTGGVEVGIAPLLHFVIPLACLWAAVTRLARKPWMPRASFAWALLGTGAMALLALPGQARMLESAHGSAVAASKLAWFVDDTADWLLQPRVASVAPGAAANPAVAVEPAAGIDPRYPFLHAERTPDVLGPLFERAPQPPNLVFVVVEGLGRSFSGPGAAHGSFTPFLDELAQRSLYFENFLANQGRTFAALPTIFGSLPFGDQGFAASADVKPLPPHVTLLSILGAQGYHTRFYAGFDLAFDKERPFLERQGIKSIVDRHDFGDMPEANSWGYADGDLVTRALADETRERPQPSLVVVQTVTMHTPFTFPGQERYAARLEQRLDELRVPAEDRGEYRQLSKIYTSALYTDDAVRALVDGLSRTPGWPSTILIVTGDHCLPELPMATRIERFHVPLLIHSPLLKAPARVKAVSSQMDLAPSLLAYLSHNYGVRTPDKVAWVGHGLDLAASFRNTRGIPLKLSKHMLSDYVEGPWYLSRGQLFELGDGLRERAADDAAALAQLERSLARFAEANEAFTQSGQLMPESSEGDWIAFEASARGGATEPVAESAVTAKPLSVSDLRAPPDGVRGSYAIEVDFTNAGDRTSRAFVPLAVVLDESGREVSETYGKAQHLAAGASVTVTLAVKTRKLKAGKYFLAVFPSDPETGKAIGGGRYRVPVRLR